MIYNKYILMFFRSQKFYRQVLEESVLSGGVCLTVLETPYVQVINDPIESECKIGLQNTVEQVRNVFITSFNRIA